MYFYCTQSLLYPVDDDVTYSAVVQGHLKVLCLNMSFSCVFTRFGHAQGILEMSSHLLQK